jgi:hypothetical protein
MGLEVEIGSKALGRVIRISVSDPDINSVIGMGFDRLVIERSTNLGISYAEITLPVDRPVLEKDKLSYTWIDRMGAPAYLYRTRYLDTRRLAAGESFADATSDPSDPIEGVGLATQCILTVEQLKQRYLFGVDFRDDTGKFLDDSVFQHYIMSAIEWFEHELDIKLLETTIVEKQDYYASDYQAYNFLQLDNYPVISVDEFNVQYPTGQTVVNYPAEWLRIDKVKGHLRVVPTAGTLSEILIGAGGSYLPAIYNGLGTLPDLFEIRYTAGFEDCRIPANILDLIGMFASLGPFNIFGDLIAGAGIANVSLSIDGLSQSIGTTSSATNAGYGSRIIQYLKQIKEQIPMLRRYYKGIRMAVA